MPTTTYEQIIRAAALKVQAIAGSSSAAVQAAYVTTPITTTQIDSPDFPLGPLSDICIQIEERLATAISNYVAESNGELFFHPWRRFISGVTASVASGALVPSTDASSNPVVGVPGLVKDASDGVQLSKLTMAELRATLRGITAGWIRSAVYGYAYDGDRIYHTRTNVTLDVCVYNRATQTTRIATVTNTILLPDALEEAYGSGMVSRLFRDDAFLPQAQAARVDFQATLENIGAGLTALARAA
jgi:hypothetical protein